MAIWFKISGTLPRAAGGFRQVSLTGVGVEKGTKAVISADSSAYGELEFNKLTSEFLCRNSRKRVFQQPQAFALRTQIVRNMAMLRQLPARFLISEVSAAAAFAGTARCRLQTVLDAQRRDQGTLHAKFAVSFVLPTPV